MSKKTPESKIKALIRNDVDKLEEIVKNLKENTISYLYTNDCNIFDPSDANFTTKEARRMLKRLSSLSTTLEGMMGYKGSLKACNAGLAE